MKNRKIIILNQSKFTLIMVCHPQCDVALLSAFQTETDKLVKDDVIRKFRPRTCAG